MSDPYKVLGVSCDASDEEIKQAYRDLVRKYHPDKYVDTDLAEMATEKMKEVNAAYEEIQRRRKAGETGSGPASGQNQNAHGPYGNGGAGTNATYANIRACINNGDLTQAQQLLAAIPEQQRDAEWNFLMGCVLLRRGDTLDAQRYLDLACAQNPYHREYRTVRDRLYAQTNAYSGGYRASRSGDDVCDCCTSLLIAHFCCSCADITRC